MADAVIVSTARTGIGRAFKGSLNLTHGAEMGGHVIKHAVERAGIDPAVSGRTDIRGVDNPATPFIHKIAVLALTDKTDGNGIGVGMAE